MNETEEPNVHLLASEIYTEKAKQKLSTALQTYKNATTLVLTVSMHMDNVSSIKIPKDKLNFVVYRGSFKVDTFVTRVSLSVNERVALMLLEIWNKFKPFVTMH